MKKNLEALPNSVVVDLSIDETGTLLFRGGWNFDEDYPEDAIEFLQDILAGIYALINTQTEAVVASGQIVRSAPGFNDFGFYEDEEEAEVIFEPDEELIKQMQEKGSATDLNVIKFDPKKHRKH